MKKIATVFFITIIIITLNYEIKAQDDCCGMGSIFSSVLSSGIFGGYGFQQYGAEGWNQLIADDPSLSENFDDYGFAHGWRVGANLIGIRHDDLLVTLKFYYQSVSETQEADGTFNGNPATQELDLKITTWGLGMGLSYILNNNFDFRILDAIMTFNNAKLTNEIRSSEENVKDEYESPETNIGVALNTGIVYYPLPPYISIEVLGGYSLFSMDTMEDEFGDPIITTDDFIDGGGFFATAVLTVGIPFN